MLSLPILVIFALNFSISGAFLSWSSSFGSSIGGNSYGGSSFGGQIPQPLSFSPITSISSILRDTRANLIASSVSLLASCKVKRDDFYGQSSESSEEGFNCDDGVFIKRKSVGNQPFWCIGLYKDSSGRRDNVDVQLSSGYKVEYEPAGVTAQNIGLFGLRFNFPAGRVVRIIIYDNGHGFPEIISIRSAGKDLCFSNEPARGEKQRPPETTPRPPKTTLRPPKTTHRPSATPQSRLDRPTPAQTPSCGRRLVPLRKLISHGRLSKPGDWPWHAAIYHNTRRSFHYKCGGTILSDRHILTAAHCVVEDGRTLIPERVSVHLGKHALQKFSAHSREYEVFAIDLHDDFDTTTAKHDLALLKLATLVKFSDYIQPACLPAEDFSIVDRVGTAVGWGRTETGQVGTTLAEAAMRVVSHMECLESHRDFFGHFLYEGNFCAGYRNGTTVCSGDSGGGLFFHHPSGVWFLRGIVSLGVRSEMNEEAALCDSTHFTLFTDVFKHLEWIKRRL